MQIAAFFKPLPNLTSIPKTNIMYKFDELDALDSFVIGGLSYLETVS